MPYVTCSNCSGLAYAARAYLYPAERCPLCDVRLEINSRSRLGAVPLSLGAELGIEREHSRPRAAARAPRAGSHDHNG